MTKRTEQGGRHTEIRVRGRGVFVADSFELEPGGWLRATGRWRRRRWRMLDDAENIVEPEWEYSERAHYTWPPGRVLEVRS